MYLNVLIISIGFISLDYFFDIVIVVVVVGLLIFVLDVRIVFFKLNLNIFVIINVISMFISIIIL